MNIFIQWQKPMLLEDGDEENLIFTIPDIENWDDLPGVYMFCRLYNSTVIPLYIGRSKNIGQRIKQHLNTTKMMKAIQHSPKGEKVLIIGEFVKKPGQENEKSLKLAEKVLIEHALTEGFKLINIAGTNPLLHTISFSGYKGAKDFSGSLMYAKQNR